MLIHSSPCPNQTYQVPQDYAIKVCNIFAQLGALGTTVFFSSGDFGSVILAAVSISHILTLVNAVWVALTVLRMTVTTRFFSSRNSLLREFLYSLSDIPSSISIFQMSLCYLGRWHYQSEP